MIKLLQFGHRSRTVGALLALLVVFHQIALAAQPCPNRVIGESSGWSLASSAHHSMGDERASEPHSVSHDPLAAFDAHCAEVDETLIGTLTDAGTSANLEPSLFARWWLPGGVALRDQLRRASATALPPPVPIAIFLHRLLD